MAVQEVFANLQPFVESSAQALLLLALLPIVFPCLLFLAVCTLVWALIFRYFKAEYDITITREALPPHPDTATVTTRDGIVINYYTAVVRSEDGTIPTVSDPKVVLFCNPLGQKGMSSWGSASAAIAQLWGPGTILICWDYRGFFESDDPKRPRTVDVRNHAEDGAVVLEEVVGDKPATLLVGHSMGVQVGLEFTLLYPEKVGAMILLNGTYGHALQTAFQPILRLPYVGSVISSVIQWFLARGHEDILEMIRRFSEPFIGILFQMMTVLFGSKSLQKLYGKDYMLKAWQQYLGGICSNAKSMKAFLRGFQDLDAHSTGHLLYQISHPTLLMAGIWDTLTPAYTMLVMKRQMANARLVLDTFSGHFSVMEHPELVMTEIAKFLAEEVPNFRRRTGSQFEKPSLKKDM
ncbi:unnamed protein product [Cladocopium goreaui]|uniref:AB hydrolase-1 domain-containing protein n=1 Tax=Cladocopium goreaui TaxID=2562237 RepID=A0A9P1CPY3_9DINO|nr:unnamed protein product [Cladocopium goreaui]|mmetsp:Transcript_70263/g.154965  ORF Transcript_70263/g.154965 Transcript_70263/m.154965 type:complete len:407 (+) Transcript_70263:52-1272(+)